MRTITLFRVTRGNVFAFLIGVALVLTLRACAKYTAVPETQVVAPSQPFETLHFSGFPSQADGVEIYLPLGNYQFTVNSADALPMWLLTIALREGNCGITGFKWGIDPNHDSQLFYGIRQMERFEFDSFGCTIAIWGPEFYQPIDSRRTLTIEQRYQQASLHFLFEYADHSHPAFQGQYGERVAEADVWRTDRLAYNEAMRDAWIMAARGQSAPPYDFGISDPLRVFGGLIIDGGWHR